MTGALTDKPAGKTLNQLPMPLDKLVALHKEWLDSEGEKGTRLDLSGYDLRKAKPFGKADLTMFIAEQVRLVCAGFVEHEYGGVAS